MAGRRARSPLQPSHRRISSLYADSILPLQPIQLSRNERIDFNPYFSFQIPRRPSEVHFPITSSDLYWQEGLEKLRRNLSIEPLSPRTSRLSRATAFPFPCEESRNSTDLTESRDSSVSDVLRNRSSFQDQHAPCQKMSGAIDPQNTISDFAGGLNIASSVNGDSSVSKADEPGTDQISVGTNRQLGVTQRLFQARGRNHLWNEQTQQRERKRSQGEYMGPKNEEDADPESWSPPAITIKLDTTQDNSSTPSTTVCGHDEARDHPMSAEASEAEDSKATSQSTKRKAASKDMVLLKMAEMLETRGKWDRIMSTLNVVMIIFMVSFADSRLSSLQLNCRVLQFLTLLFCPIFTAKNSTNQNSFALVSGRVNALSIMLLEMK